MVEESVLTDDFIRQLINVGEVDILVGLATDNNAGTVGPILRTIQAGLLKSFPRERIVIINADGGSRDGTPELVTGASVDDMRRAYSGQTLRTLHSVSTCYASSPSSEAALRTILAAAELLRAKACAVISPETTNIEPEWIARLLRPVYQENFDLVMPLYRRNKVEGLLMRNLVYPMTRAVYGKRIREPYASEFSFSGRLGSDFLARDIWEHDGARFGREMELVIGAITGNYRICQTYLGDKERVERRGPDLVTAMRQTVAVLFSSMDTTFSFWSGGHGSQPIPTNGPEADVSLEPVRINRKRLKQMFSDGVAELEPVFKSILPASTLSALQNIASLSEEDFRYPAELWARTVYEFAAAYHKSVISRDHIIQALAPLYRGRVFTFMAENRSGSAEDVENNIENLCCEFERSKPYLLELCDGGK